MVVHIGLGIRIGGRRACVVVLIGLGGSCLVHIGLGIGLGGACVVHLP